MNSEMIKKFLENEPPLKKIKHPLNLKKNKEGKKELIKNGKRVQ